MTSGARAMATVCGLTSRLVVKTQLLLRSAFLAIGALTTALAAVAAVTVA